MCCRAPSDRGMQRTCGQLHLESRLSGGFGHLRPGVVRRMTLDIDILASTLLASLAVLQLREKKAKLQRHLEIPQMDVLDSYYLSES